MPDGSAIGQSGSSGNHRSLVSHLPRSLQPLSRRLPLFVISIVSIMIGVVVYLGFRRVDRLVVEVTAAHLEASSRQFQTMLETSARRLRREVGQLATAPQLRVAAGVFASDSEVKRAANLLAGELRRPQTRAVALWSERGELRVVEGDAGLARASPLPTVETRPTSPDTATTSVDRLIVRGDSVFIRTHARIAGSAGNSGRIAITRGMASNPEALTLLRGLVGEDARILLGNADGSAWTDFTRDVRGPAQVPDSGSGQHDIDGEAYLHATAPIAGTPWVVMVEVPRAATRAAAGLFVAEMVGAALGLLAIGGALLWLTIHRSLQPLHAVTAGVVRLASGERSVAVPVASDDELGRLSAAFNSMSTQVRQGADEVASRALTLETRNVALRESEHRYRVLVDHLPDALVVHRDHLITFANRAAANLLGATTPDELVGRSVLTFVDAKDRAAVARMTRAVQENGSGVPRREITLRGGDGVARVVEVTSMPLNVDGSAAVQTILHDVTERRALEEQFRQSQKMDAVGRLAGGVAHDFNNILTVIDAHAEFAMRPSELEATRLADIGEIRKASASAARLTRQLLAFSRKQALSPVRVDLNLAVQGLTAMLSRLIGTGVTISTDLTEPLWPVFADSGHVEQILMNLSVNARDAMPQGGTLTFRTRHVVRDVNHLTPAGECIPPGEYVQLEVEDTGSGMTPEVMSNVFEPFFTTKQPGQGTGLGLATVYGIVKQSGGYISIDSEVGRGTTFSILFPRHTADEELMSVSRTSEHRIPALTASILLVEDQPAVRGALSRAMRNAGHIVHEAADAEEAEALLGRADSPAVDLIITDMMMPGKTGAEFTSGPLVADRDIPVVIMSGYSEEFTNREWRLPPNASFLDKPVAPSDLLRLISRLIG